MGVAKRRRTRAEENSAARGREQSIELGDCRVGEEIFPEVASITGKKTRGPLVDDVSREQVQRSVNVTEALAVEKPLFTLGGESLRFVERAREIL